MNKKKCVVVKFCENEVLLNCIKDEFRDITEVSVKEIFSDEFYRVVCANFEAIKEGNAFILGINYPFKEALDIDNFKQFLKEFKQKGENLYYFPKPIDSMQINNIALFALCKGVTLDVFRLGLLQHKGEISQFTKERLQKMIYAQNEQTKDSFKLFCKESKALFELSPFFKEFNASKELNFLNLTKRATYFYKAPRGINIKMHNRCNLKCVMCWHFAPKYKDLRQKLVGDYFSTKKELDTQKIYEIIDYAGENKCTLELAALGEPTMDKRLPDFVAYARKRGCPIVGITTNATLLNKELTKKLLDSGLNRILFSVDGANAETYEKIRGVKLEKTEQNIHNFINECKNYEDVRIRLNCVLEGDAINEQDKYLNKWSKYQNDIQSLNFTPVTIVTEDGRGIKEGVKTECVGEKICTASWFPDSLVIGTSGDVLPDCVCPDMRESATSAGGGGNYE